MEIYIPGKHTDQMPVINAGTLPVLIQDTTQRLEALEMRMEAETGHLRGNRIVVPAHPQLPNNTRMSRTPNLLRLYYQEPKALRLGDGELQVKYRSRFTSNGWLRVSWPSYFPRRRYDTDIMVSWHTDLPTLTEVERLVQEERVNKYGLGTKYLIDTSAEGKLGKLVSLPEEVVKDEDINLWSNWYVRDLTSWDFVLLSHALDQFNAGLDAFKPKSPRYYLANFL